MYAWMKPVLSLVIGGIALYIILTRSGDEAARQWAVGSLAFILGYWLKGGRETLEG